MATNKIFTKAALCSAIAMVSGLIQAQAVLEEVVVTAQKRTQSLQEVPISIAVIDADTIAKTGIRSVREMADFVPNVTISSGNDNNTAVRIRGVGSNSRNIGFDTRVGVYLDGIYLGQSPAQNMNIMDLERIEVLRGPQGTLFGKNTVAGAINLISQKPTADFEGEVRAEYGNYNSHRVSAMVNVPLSADWTSRFAVSDNHRDGYIENITTGNDQGEQDATSFRGQLNYDGDSYRINFAADYLESDRVSTSGEAVSDAFGTVSPDPLAPKRLEISNNVDNAEEREVWGVSATVDAELGKSGYSVKSITAYRDTTSDRTSDTDHSAGDLVTLNYPDQYEQLTQELQIISPNDSAFTFVAGLYYFDEQATTDRTLTFGADIGDAFLTPSTAPLAPLGFAFDGAAAGTFGDVDTKSLAAYFHGTFDLTDKLTLGLGARYTEEEKTIDYALVGDIVDLSSFVAPGFVVPAAQLFGLAIGSSVVNGQTVAQVNDKNDYSEFSPSISLNYLMNDNTNLYVKYASAFKSGGFNADFVDQAAIDSGLAFDTETVDSYELGMKGSALDNRLRYSIAVFQMKFDDYQLNQIKAVAGGFTSPTIENAAEVTSRGWEAEVTWLATDNLLVQGSVGKTDAKFNSFPGGGSQAGAGAGADLSGNELPTAPGLSAAMTIQHTLPLDKWDAEWVSRLEWSYSDDYYTTADNTTVSAFYGPGGTVPFGFVDSYSLFNVRIGMESEGWSAMLWARNLLDEEYITGDLRDGLGTIVDIPGEPRTYGVELSYKF
ncbi:MAG: iron complex outermembrane receptor protein [Pseudohongiellaceae bacterium]|jgi:iron complex outermembrane receptor protein